MYEKDGRRKKLIAPWERTPPLRRAARPEMIEKRCTVNIAPAGPRLLRARPEIAASTCVGSVVVGHLQSAVSNEGIPTHGRK